MHWNNVVPQGVQLSHTHGAHDIPLELVIKRVFPGNTPTGLKKFITPETEPDIGHPRRQLGRRPLDSHDPTASAADECEG